MKHAYLILAHNNYGQLQLLVNLLDDKRNTIFVHIDKKTSVPELHSKISKVVLLDDRIDVRWGDYSLIKAELALMSKALNYGSFDYFHLLSGACLPIKSNDEIDNFFIQNGKGKVYITYSPQDQQIAAQSRLNKYHFFTRYYRINDSNKLLSLSIRIVRKILELVINFCFKRERIECRKGDNWFSIPYDCCKYVVEISPSVLNRFKYSYCGDEQFIQTIIWNTCFTQRLYKSTTRAIDWERGSPYVWGAEENDFKKLISSDMLFARKFDIQKYPDIIYKLYEYIMIR